MRFAAAQLLCPAAAAAAAPASRCAEFNASWPAGWDNQQLDLAVGGASLRLGGNNFGVVGRRTNLRQCVFDLGGGAFGWNWTRGVTHQECDWPASVGGCPGAPCFYQFSYARVAYGTSAIDGSSTGAGDMPVDTSALRSFAVSLDASYEWTDDAPADPAQRTRSRLIFDFFLSSAQPQANTSVGSTVTDEIVIDLAYNPGFKLACVNHSDTPRERGAVADGAETYDFFDATPGDVPAPGLRCRMNHFRRVGGDVSGAAPPAKIDLLPFIRYVSRLYGGTSGAWLGQVTVGTEQYDSQHGEVLFHSPPSFTPVARRR